jgi:hypothetical protein
MSELEQKILIEEIHKNAENIEYLKKFYFFLSLENDKSYKSLSIANMSAKIACDIWNKNS